MTPELSLKNLSRPSVAWIAALAAVIVAVVLLRDILLPFVAGIALAYLLDPAVERLERFGINRTIAALGILSLFFVSVAVIAATVIPILGTEVAAFIESVPNYISQLQAFAADPSRPWLRKIIGEGLSEAEQSAGEIASIAADWMPGLLRSVWSDSQAVISALSLLIVTPIVTFYLIKDWNHVVAVIDRSIPAPQRETVLALGKELDETVSGFLRGQGTICLILSVYYAIALDLIGLNHGILIGLAAGLISFVPYLGLFAGLLVSLCVTVLQFGPDWKMISAVIGTFIAGQAIADYALAPYLVASKIHLNPVWIMFAITAFGYLFGLVGLIIAVPLAAAIGVLIRFAMRQLLGGPLDAAKPSP
ncbi:MAG: AI-2E family transporter [Beijerinckiaceae bacterium]|nr:AI-2E family transporter [Beijerinckiaceae bacterium]